MSASGEVVAAYDRNAVHFDWAKGDRWRAALFPKETASIGVYSAGTREIKIRIAEFIRRPIFERESGKRRGYAVLGRVEGEADFELLEPLPIWLVLGA